MRAPIAHLKRPLISPFGACPSSDGDARTTKSSKRLIGKTSLLRIETWSLTENSTLDLSFPCASPRIHGIRIQSTSLELRAGAGRMNFTCPGYRLLTEVNSERRRAIIIQIPDCRLHDN